MRVGKARPNLTWHTPKPPFFWVALILGAAFLFVYICAASFVYRYGATTKTFGWGLVPAENHLWQVTDVRSDGPAANKLQRGDRIIGINGDSNIQGVSVLWYRFFLPPDSTYTLRVRRKYQELTESLYLPPLQPSADRVWAVLYLWVSLSFFVLALLMGVLKPGERVTQIGFVACLVIALRILWLALPANSLSGQGPASTLFIALEMLDPWYLILGYQFFYCFTSNVLNGRLWRVLNIGLYAVGTTICVVDGITNMMAFQGLERVVRFAREHAALMRLIDDVHRVRFPYYEAFGLLAMCAVIVRANGHAQDADQHRRVRWLMFGSLAGLTPEFAYLILRVLNTSGIVHSSQQFITLFRLIVNIWLVVIPVSIGYAVLKYRALGIAVVLRQGFKYLLARNVLQFILLLPLLGLVISVVQHRDRTITQLLTHDLLSFDAVLILGVGLSLRYRRQLRILIDRQFFREAYDQEQILLELIDEIKELDNISEIAHLVSRQVDNALHPRRVTIFYREKERSDMLLGYSSEGVSGQPCIAEDAPVMRIMQSRSAPLDFPISGDDSLSTADSDWLERLQAHLIVPIPASTRRLGGLLILGEKKSEEVYTAGDRKLLQTIAKQMGNAHERFWLKDQVAADQRIRLDVLAHLDHQQVNLLRECPECGRCFDNTVAECSADGKELTITLPVDRVLDSKYRLDRRIGRGGMGAVFEATDLRLNRRVAVKVMMGSLFGNRAALRRFEREAQAAANLNHVNIIQIHDFGRIGEDGAFLVMQHLSGSTLRHELNVRRTIDPAVAAEWFNQLLEGIKAAHAVGIVHRDLKPENVMIVRGDTGGDVIKIVDFGLAKMRVPLSEETNSLTAPGTVLGTFGYMAPEQLLGQESDERADIFSTGVMVLEMITGQHPFKSRSVSEQLRAFGDERFHLPADSPELARLDSAIGKCLAVDPNQRFRTAAEVQRELIEPLRLCPPFVPVSEYSAHFETRSAGT